MSRPTVSSSGQSKAEIDFLARPAKELVLPGVACGECQQDPGKLVFNADGSGTWSCTTTNWDENRTATWHTDFALQDSAGKTLFGIGPFYSLCMEPRSQGHAYAHICIRQFEFPTAYFAEIVSVSQNYGCLFGLPAGARQTGQATSGHLHHSADPAKPVTRSRLSDAESVWFSFSAFSTR
ncbi:hypothetical protein [Granulicella sibirica]|uniref:Uncharacterized protein n=1 Tax=Granulicella sibirica TaxID=2479048 RepID=A0A4Q0T0B6_9BACT|nr:hypothetical protein [Granulicella sibirica]RXH54816.1 hypothetical protein GRAN_3920 [Granulicella sibirica]